MPRRVSSRSVALIAIGVALAVLGLESCGQDSGTGRTASASLSPAHGPAGASARSPARGAATTRSPAATALGRAILSAMRLAGPGAITTGAVYDLTTQRWLFRHEAGTRTEPASVEKLYTTAAVVRLLGPNATLQTQVLGEGSLGPGGVWHGNLYLKGGGDPTFGNGSFLKTYEGGYGSTATALVQQLVKAGIHRVAGEVIADESLFDENRGGLMTNYKPDTPDFGGQLSALTYNHGSATSLKESPAVFAANQVVATMRQMGIQARAAKQTAVAPVGAQLLATVDSPRMSVMLRLMDVPSDDLFAELFTKQLGVRFGGGVGSIAAGAAVISQTVATDYGVHPLIQDGSGLSKGDRSDPFEVIKLLSELWHTPTGRVLVASLPVVGVDGTVQNIALKTAAVRNCAAKTGTLDTVTNLAGYCRSRQGDMLIFAFFVQGPSNYVAIPLIGDMVAAVARY